MLKPRGYSCEVRHRVLPNDPLISREECLASLRSFREMVTCRLL